MAFPSVDTFLKQAFVSGTVHNVDMPSTVVANDLLMMVVSARKEGTTFSSVSGWTKMYEETADFCIAVTWLRVADGTEGGTSVDVGTTASRSLAVHVYRVSAWFNDLAGVERATSKSSSLSPNPPSLSPSWGADDTLWLALCQNGQDDVLFSSFPASYTNADEIASGAGTGNGCAVGSARRSLNAASEDPGTFTQEAFQSWTATTIGIRPSSGGVLVERTVTDGVFIPDQDTKLRESLDRGEVLFRDSAIRQALFTITDGLLTLDQRSSLSSILASNGVFLNDLTTRLQEGVNSDGVFFDEATQSLRDLLISNGLLFASLQTKQEEKTLQDGLLLVDSVTAEIVEEFISRLVTDGLFLFDQQTRIEEHIQQSPLLLRDLASLERTLSRSFDDGLFLADQQTKELQLSLTDKLLVQSTAIKLVESLLREELLVDDPTVSAILIEAAAQALSFVLLGKRDFMGIRIGWVPPVEEDF